MSGSFTDHVPVIAAVGALALLLSAFGDRAAAINRIVVEADSLELSGGVRAENLRATLGLEPRNRATLQSSMARINVGKSGPALREVQLDCATVVVHEPQFACREGRLAVADSPLGKLQGQFDLLFQSEQQQLDLNLQRLALGGGMWQLQGRWRPQQWRINGSGSETPLTSLVALLRPWWTLPKEFTLKGTARIGVDAEGNGAQLHAATLTAEVSQLDLQNQAGSIVTERVQAALTVALTGQLSDLGASLRLQGLSGQALAGPVLLDFTAKPLSVNATGRIRAAGVSLSQIEIEQPGLLHATGRAELAREPSPGVISAVFDVTALQFPAAYTSLLQLSLATTSFGALDTSGSASGRIELRSSALASIDLQLAALNFSDAKRQLNLAGLTGDLHWRAAGESAPPASMLSWQQLRAFGIEGGASTVQLRAQGAGLALTRPARISMFDGALSVQRFNAGGLGGSNVSLEFDANIEPISMQKLSVAFGWPEMSGQLSGRVPGLEFRNGTLSVAGDIVADVFDGRVTASKLQLRNVLGGFPRLSGDFRARALDLGLITRTFPIGTITGRLDADILALELFGWSPIAFDAHLYTTAGDRTRHRISQKAVGSLANIGGGGGGVTAALQSGLLRFFDDFGYDRIGLRCQLRDDVCLMDGIPRSAGSFYIVKGGGLPRIDVIGNSGRVAWAQLVSQVSAALAADSVEVR